MRIAIANDSRASAEALRRVLAASGEHELAWIARSGDEAVRMCAADLPDLVLMDLDMPGLDGVEATRAIMQASPCPILVVTASPRDQVGQVFRALGAGALDVTATPVLLGRPGGSRGLLDKIAMIGKLTGKGPRRHAPAGAAPAPGVARLLAIGASTGGPVAISALLSGWLPAPDTAVVVVQHIDAAFANQFVSWLAGQLQAPVRAAAEGERPAGGTVLVARTNDHLRLAADRTLRYDPEPRTAVYRPSVDVFFDSVARHWSADATGVLLTGIGRDGAAGLLAMRRAGQRTLAQDQASCAVYGMPRAAAELDAAEKILPPDQMNNLLRRTLSAAPPLAL